MKESFFSKSYKAIFFSGVHVNDKDIEYLLPIDTNSLVFLENSYNVEYTNMLNVIHEIN